MPFPNAAKAIATRVAFEVSKPLRPTPICMLHVGRVGSTVLADMLERHTRLAAYGEIYHKEWEDIFQTTRFRNYTRPRDPYYNVKSSIVKARQKFPIFEIKFLPWQHLNMMADSMEELISHLNTLGVRKFILLERKNLLRRVISVQRIIESGQAHSRKEAEGKRKTVRIDPQNIPLEGPFVSFEEYCDTIISAQDEVKRLIPPDQLLHLTYEEDILNNPMIAYQKSCSFIGVEAEQIEPRLRRTNPFSTSETIENIDELRTSLNDSRHYWMLQD